MRNLSSPTFIFSKYTDNGLFNNGVWFTSDRNDHYPRVLLVRVVISPLQLLRKTSN